MDRKLFVSLLNKRLYPRLRLLGFRGSGSTLRRLAEPVVEVFNVQGSSGGNRCYFNVGVHLTFLPAEGGQVVPAGALMESHCAFHSRINPPTGHQFGWEYGRTLQEAEATVDQALVEWERQAQPFFEMHSYPTGLKRLIEELQVSATHPKHLLTYARVAWHLGQHEEAIGMGRSALERVAPSASGLRQSINDFLSRAASQDDAK